MLINTKHLGTVEIEENEILYFEEGIPGFLEYKHFVTIPLEMDLPFYTLQSIDKQEVAFIVLNPFVYKKDYEFDLSAEALEQLKIKSPEQVEVYNILFIPEEMQNLTANLKAPVIINRDCNKGMQVVLQEEDYSIKHFVFEQIREAAQKEA